LRAETQKIFLEEKKKSASGMVDSKMLDLQSLPAFIQLQTSDGINHNINTAHIANWHANFAAVGRARLEIQDCNNRTFVTKRNVEALVRSLDVESHNRFVRNAIEQLTSDFKQSNIPPDNSGI
jgi:hypothetical protein